MDRSWGYGSDRRNRQDNQDRLGVFELPHCTLAIVCDGTGSHVGGASAATLAIRVVYDHLISHPQDPPAEALRDALERANTEVYEAARKDHRLMGMGTTAVAAVMKGDQVVIAHVGDSRAYLIHSGQAKVATRDHTMVNLFVDAELLTPEDAATHPEAHVLSRSIGTERQVEVDVSPSVQLADGDVVLLCSDGVHGVIADFELSDLEWSNPHGAIRELLEVVVEREGEDSASAVALRLGAANVECPPETPFPTTESAPEAVPIGEASQLPRRNTEGDTDVDDPDEAVDIPGGEPGGAGEIPTYVVFEEAPKLPEVRSEDLREKARAAGSRPPEAEARPRRVPALLIGLAALGIVVASLGAGWVWRQKQRDALVARAIAAARAAEAEPQAVASAPIPEQPPLAVEPVETFFSTTIPDPPKRPKHRPAKFLASPPKSREQVISVNAARSKECAAALDAVDQGMAYSPDHAPLYEVAWGCFDAAHGGPVLAAKLYEPAALADLLPHLQGDPTLRPLDKEAEKLPTWAQPAVDGLEYRLDAIVTPKRGEKMVEILSDRLGAGRFADTLGADLVLEAEIAAALAAAPSLTSEQQIWWARRLFVVSRFTASPVWAFVQSQRPDLSARVDAAMDAATHPKAANGDLRPLPSEVSTALAAGQTGERPAPKKSEVSASRAPLEPTDEDLAAP